MENEDTIAELPPLDEVLIKSLRQRFPVVFPDLEWTDREIWYKAGQLSIIEFLTQHYIKQQEDDVL